MKPSNMLRLPALRVALLALCTTAFAVPLPAQDAPPAPPAQGPGRGGGERQMEMMTKQLNLTPDQVTQIKTIQTEGRSKMMALRGDTTIAQDDKRQKMMAMREEEQGKIRAVLTDDQKTRYDAMLKQMQERRGNGGNGGPPPPPPSGN